MKRAERRARNAAINERIAEHLAQHDPEDAEGRGAGLLGCAALALLTLGACTLVLAAVLCVVWLVHA